MDHSYTMEARLANNKTVSQQKQPLIVVVRDINERQQKKIFIKHDSNEIQDEQFDEDGDTSDLQQTQVEYYENRDGELSESGGGLIWSHKRPSSIDSNATEYFLQIRGSDKYKQLFADKKFGKIRIWSQIATEMNNAGYYVGEGREAAERCRQKFSNLEKGFLNYVRHIKNGNKKSPPVFYNLMQNIVDAEDKLFKREQSAISFESIRESLQVDLLTPNEQSNLSAPSDNNDDFDCTPRINSKKFQKMKEKNEIITLLTKQHAETIKLQKNFLEKLDTHLTIQNEQRERLINSFIGALNEENCDCTRGKRRRSSSNESDI